jgi:xylose isomerase
MTDLPRFATRLNAFAIRPELFWADARRKPTPLDCLERAASVDGLNAVDLNFPDHLDGVTPDAMREALQRLGLGLNGFAMRYYSDPAFRMGAFTNPDPAVRRRAIDLTRRGIDVLQACGGDLMTLWLGQDGFDYPFQGDYRTLWELELDGIRECALHAPEVLVSLEYKPNEPRAFALLPDAATTLLAIRELDLPNLGVTLDFAHVLYADEQPAYAAALVARHSRLLGVHLNDGYGKRDDGLMVGSVHPVQTLEFLRQVRRDGYTGAIYFDTFPDIAGIDPVAECAANIATVRAMWKALDRLDGSNALSAALATQDAVAAQRIVRELTLGSGDA